MIVYVKRIGKEMRKVLIGVSDSSCFFLMGFCFRALTSAYKTDLHHTPAPHLRMQCFLFTFRTIRELLIEDRQN